MNKLLPLLFILFSSLYGLNAQTIDLDSVIVSGSRFTVFSLNDQPVFNDSLSDSRIQQLDKLLSTKTDLFVKNYGPSNISTVSARGADASHTTLLWNGFNLHNPMNGVTDFSLIAPGQFSSISLHTRGASSLAGTASMGGVVLLDNKLANQQGLHGHVGSSIGSFSTFGSQAGLKWRKGKSGSDMFIAYGTSKNNFRLNGTERRRENAGATYLNAGQNNYWQISDSEKIQTHLWYQYTDRGTPGPIFSANFNDQQRDNILRAAISYQKTHARAISQIRAAWLQEFQLFDNNLIEASNNLVKSIVLEAEHEIQLDASQNINGGINFINNTAVSNNFDEVLQRYQYAAFILYSKNWNDRFKTNISGRGTYISDLELSNFSGEISQSWQALENLGLELAFSKNFKAPTFNDLYWPNSGNPNLQPETGYNQEFNTKWNYQLNSWKIFQDLNGFSNHISNWIQWLPGPPDGQFRPVNHKFVWSRGFSTGISTEKNWDKFKFEAGIQYTFTRSTVLNTNDGDPEKLDKQLIYVPLHAGKANISLQFKKWSIDYLHHLVGNRFTNAYNSTSINGFHTADLQIDYRWKTGNDEIMLGAGIQNIWNKEYEIVAYYPMPPRSFSLSLNFSY